MYHLSRDIKYNRICQPTQSLNYVYKQNLSDNEMFSVRMSCNNGDYEFTKAVWNFVNLSFEILCDHPKSVNQII